MISDASEERLSFYEMREGVKLIANSLTEPGLRENYVGVEAAPWSSEQQHECITLSIKKEDAEFDELNRRQ